MARRARSSSLETRTSRLRLPVRKKPYAFTVIAPGIAVGYRRCAGPGRWVLRAANGRGGYWTDVIGLADDHEDANGDSVLSFWQAQDRARILVRGKEAEGDRPITVAAALDDYETDLQARRGRVGNARYPRTLLSPTLLSRPVGLLTSKELRRWRDGLLAGRTPSSVTRICKMLAAALSLAAKHDSRIVNRDAWRLGLAALPDAHVARHAGLTEAQVRAIVSAAYEIHPAFGLWTECLAVTGARPSQIARLTVDDLQPDRLLMPSSAKGKGHKRVRRFPVPLPTSLVVNLRQAAHGRRPGDPLLRRPDGQPWRPGGGEHFDLFTAAATAAGVPEATAYSLRHSSIIRMLLAGTPAQVTARLHDTSTTMLERTYAAYILDHSDAIARRSLLDLAQPAVDNVIPIARH
jgi:integrase